MKIYFDFSIPTQGIKSMIRCADVRILATVSPNPGIKQWASRCAPFMAPLSYVRYNTHVHTCCHDLFLLRPFRTPFWTSKPFMVMFRLTFVSYLFNPVLSPFVYSTWLPGAYFLMTLCSVLTCCLFHLYSFTCLTYPLVRYTDPDLIEILLCSIKDM